MIRSSNQSRRGDCASYLAEDIGGGRYRLAGGSEDTLRRMGERGDLVRLMQRELTARRLDRAGVEQVVMTSVSEPIIGRVIHRGFSDEHRDRHYLMVDGTDGRVHYSDIGRGDGLPSVLDRQLAEGATHAPRDIGFGREVRTALAARRQWLIEQQLATGECETFRLREGAVDALRDRELRRAGEGLADRLGKRFESARMGERVEGIIARRVDLESGSYALVERSRISPSYRGATCSNATSARPRRALCGPTGSAGNLAGADQAP